MIDQLNGMYFDMYGAKYKIISEPMMSLFGMQVVTVNYSNGTVGTTYVRQIGKIRNKV